MFLYLAIYNYNTGTNDVQFLKDEKLVKATLRNIIRDYYDDSDDFDDATDGIDSVNGYVQLIEEIDSNLILTWGVVPALQSDSRIEKDVLNRFVEEANQWPDNRDDEPLVESFPGYTPILTIGDIRKIAELKTEKEITF